MTALPWVISIVGGFLLGSIPWGVIIASCHGIDIRQHGSKNIGATNVGRVLGRKFGFLCFALDALKGAIGVILVSRFVVPEATSAETIQGVLVPLVGLAAILGHVFSPWVGFKGGKGVATTFGALLAMWPLMTYPAIGALIIWLVVVATVRIVSLASMLAALALPTLFILNVGWPLDATGRERVTHYLPLLGFATALAVLVVSKHRANISRLLNGTEPRVLSAKPRPDR